ncbi:MAG: hypothetical protein MJ171_06275 [Clostridia bacterium]|nr:hypothetical protein [Clostridia bacterium]
MNRNSFREKIAGLFYNRYGFDILSRDLTYLSCILMVVSLFIRLPFSNLLILVPMGFAYYRAFSKNIQKRYSENAWYMEHVRGRLVSGKQKIKKDRTYRYFRCPECGMKLRAPRGTGKIEVTCRQCGKRFRIKV